MKVQGLADTGRFKTSDVTKQVAGGASGVACLSGVNAIVASCRDGTGGWKFGGACLWIRRLREM